MTVQISDWNDLSAIRNDTDGETYELQNDLDETVAGYAEVASVSANGGEGFNPITDVGNGITIEGNGNTISDFYITDSYSSSRAGLFGYTSVNNATVRNINFSDCFIGYDTPNVERASVIVGEIRNEWTFENITFTNVNIWSTGRAGCLIGYLRSGRAEATNIEVDNVTVDGEGYRFGMLYGEAESEHITSDVVIKDSTLGNNSIEERRMQRSGFICGTSSGARPEYSNIEIKGCDAAISDDAGGIVGYSNPYRECNFTNISIVDTTIKGYWRDSNGNYNHPARNVGGLIGSTHGGANYDVDTVYLNLAIFDVQGEPDTGSFSMSDRRGGVVGSFSGNDNLDIQNTISSSYVEGENEVGGFIGTTSSSNITFSQCIFTGRLKSPDYDMCAFAGYGGEIDYTDDNTRGVFYWDYEQSGVPTFDNRSATNDNRSDPMLYSEINRVSTNEITGQDIDQTLTDLDFNNVFTTTDSYPILQGIDANIQTQQYKFPDELEEFASQSNATNDLIYEIYDWNDFKSALSSRKCYTLKLQTNLNETTDGYSEVASSSANGGTGYDFTSMISSDNYHCIRIDGNGYEISNVKMLSVSRGSHRGFIEKLDKLALVNVDFTDIKIEDSNKNYCGIVSRNNGGVFYNISVQNIDIGIKGADNTISYSGALIGREDNVSLVSTVDVENVNIYNADRRVGGLVGETRGNMNKFLDCTVDVYIDSCDRESGGFVGYADNNGTDDYIGFKDCSVEGEIHHRTSNSFHNIGGFVGYSEWRTFRNCYADVDIIADVNASSNSHYRIGLFGGHVYGKQEGNINIDEIKQSFASGSIDLEEIGGTGFDDIGGFIGRIREISRPIKEVGVVGEIIIDSIPEYSSSFIGRYRNSENYEIVNSYCMVDFISFRSRPGDTPGNYEWGIWTSKTQNQSDTPDLTNCYVSSYIPTYASRLFGRPNNFDHDWENVYYNSSRMHIESLREYERNVMTALDTEQMLTNDRPMTNVYSGFDFDEKWKPSTKFPVIQGDLEEKQAEFMDADLFDTLSVNLDMPELTDSDSVTVYAYIKDNENISDRGEIGKTLSSGSYREVTTDGNVAEVGFIPVGPKTSTPVDLLVIMEANIDGNVYIDAKEVSYTNDQN